VGVADKGGLDERDGLPHRWAKRAVYAPAIGTAARETTLLLQRGDGVRDRRARLPTGRDAPAARPPRARIPS